MIGLAASSEIPATADPIAAWTDFLASPAASKGAMSILELDGYLTGVIVAPKTIPPGRWMAAPWGDDGTIPADGARAELALQALRTLFNEIGARIDASLRGYDADHVRDYRPAFLATDEKPPHDVVRQWASGFFKAMQLDPSSWNSLFEDARMKSLIEPFVGFFGVDDPNFVPADNYEELLDEAAAQIPRAISLLRKLARIEAERTRAPAPVRRAKLGRNEPCSCGSGRKYKRCRATA